MASDDHGSRAATEERNGTDTAAQDRTLETYKKLRELIVQGRLAPGSRIVETEVAERLGVSRTPVGSALQRLRQEGYVVSVGEGKRSGSAVAPLTKQDAEELLYIMGVLESLAARHCAERDAETRVAIADRLQRANDELAEVARAEPLDRNRILQLDEEFHQTYVSAGAGSRLRTFHDIVRPQKERYLRVYLMGLADAIETSLREHQRVVEAIRRGDPVAAEEAVTENWRNGARRLASVIERRGEWGSW